MSVTGTLKKGFGAKCGTCKTEFTDELFDTVQELNAEMVKAKWQIFPTCCAKCIKELGVWYTDDRPKNPVPARATPSKPTKKESGDDPGPVRRRMRRRLL